MTTNKKAFRTLPKDVVKIQNNTYGFGNNISAHSSGNAITSVSKPQRSVVAIDMVAGSCSFSHTILLADNGYVYGFGSNQQNKILGNGIIPEPDELILPLTFIMVGVKQVVASGLQFGNTLVVTETGVAQAWGQNAFSSCWGNGDTTPQYSRRTIDTDIDKAAGSSSHTVLLKNNGDVWAFGANNVGQSRGDGDTLLATTSALIYTDCIDVAVSEAHTVLLKSNGDVWAFGQNVAGEVRGDGTTSPSELNKFLMTSNGRKVACGNSTTYVLKNDDTLWACGANTSGQCRGNGTTSTNQAALFLMASNVSDFGVGSSHIFIKYNDGTMWGCGSNNNGQVLGDGTVVTPHPTLTILQDNRNTRWLMNDSADATNTMYGVAEKLTDTVG